MCGSFMAALEGCTLLYKEGEEEENSHLCASLLYRLAVDTCDIRGS